VSFSSDPIPFCVDVVIVPFRPPLPRAILTTKS
jgi:hypothetical protein